MTEPDTHCSRCGSRLIPFPSFTMMKWECPCSPNGSQSSPQIGMRTGKFLDLLRVYGVGITLRVYGNSGAYLFVARVVSIDPSTDMITIETLAPTVSTGPYPRAAFEGLTAEMI